MKRQITVAALALAAVAAPMAAQAADSVTLKFISGWDDRFEGTKFIAHRFGEMVKKETDGRIKVVFVGPEVVTPRQQFQPVSAGAFDMHLNTPAYSLGTTGVMFAYYALPPDTEMWREKGYWQYADEELGHFNQKLIGFPAGGSSDNVYQIVLKEALKPGPKPFEGKKIRGNVFYKPIVAPLGGSLVNLDGGEIYSSLQKGVIDGAAWPVIGAVNFKFYEVSKYMMRPRFGQSPYSVAMNMDTFKKLSKADQDLVLKIGRSIEGSAPKDFDEASEAEIKKLKELGMKETELDPKLFAEINQGFLKGVWDLAINFNKSTKDRAQKLYDMAKKNGDAP